MLSVAAVVAVAGCAERRSPDPTAVTLSTAPAGRVRNPADTNFGVAASPESLDRRTFQLDEAAEGQPSTLSLTFTVEGDLYLVSDCGQLRGHYQLVEDRLNLDAMLDGLTVACATAASAQLNSVLSALTLSPVLRIHSNMLALVTDTATFRLLERDPGTPPPIPSR